MDNKSLHFVLFITVLFTLSSYLKNWVIITFYLLLIIFVFFYCIKKRGNFFENIKNIFYSDILDGATDNTTLHIKNLLIDNKGGIVVLYLSFLLSFFTTSIIQLRKKHIQMITILRKRTYAFVHLILISIAFIFSIILIMKTKKKLLFVYLFIGIIIGIIIPLTNSKTNLLIDTPYCNKIKEDGPNEDIHQSFECSSSPINN